MVDLDELERLAKEATPGPWFVSDEYTGIVVDSNDIRVASTYADKPYDVIDGKFIAAFNPAVAAELIRRLREAERDAEKEDEHGR